MLPTSFVPPAGPFSSAKRAPTDHVGDVPQQNAFLGDTVIRERARRQQISLRSSQAVPFSGAIVGLSVGIIQQVDAGTPGLEANTTGSAR
jgi:hypothetical protein